MSWLTRAILRRVSPETRAAMEAESRRWQLVCTKCGWSRSVWETGGIRYRARSKGKRTLGRCPNCGKWRWFRVELRS